MRPSRRRLALPAVLTLAGTLTACGGCADPGAAPSTARSSAPSGAASSGASAVAADDTADDTTDDTAAGPTGDGTTGTKASGTPTTPVVLTTASFVGTTTTAQQAAGSYDFSVDETSDGRTLRTTGSVRLGPPMAIAMASVQPEGTLELRLVDGLMYVNTGEPTQNLFVKIDPNDPDDPFSAAMGDSLDQVDPATSIQSQQSGLVSVTAKGAPEQLDGVVARPYEVVVDPSRVTGPARAALDAAARYGQTLPATIVSTYWVGSDGLIRRMSTELLGVRSEMTLTHWGAGAAVVAPRADQITTFDGLEG